jgi:hypothetical protein
MQGFKGQFSAPDSHGLTKEFLAELSTIWTHPRTYEISVYLNETTRRYIPENCHLQPLLCSQRPCHWSVSCVR